MMEIYKVSCFRQVGIGMQDQNKSPEECLPYVETLPGAELRQLYACPIPILARRICVCLPVALCMSNFV